MSFFRHALSNVRKGRDLDAYITIVVAVVLACLNLLDVVPQDKITGVTLGVLALLAISTVVTRSRLDAMGSGTSRKTELYESFPASFLEDFQSSGDLILVDPSAARVLNVYHKWLEGRLRAGASVKVLVVDPDGSATKLNESRAAFRVNLSSRRSILDSLETLSDLRAETNAGLEVRLTDQQLLFGAAVFRPDSSAAVIYVNYFRYKVHEHEQMKLVLRPSDSPWYDLHRLQIERMWVDARPFEPRDRDDARG